ncbi:hypothetical protein C0Q70_20521 [Pomacea canaliculata]|uniref:Uncharacterized protein n=1 Tax=Pomacea canaliculata TaxID=400727 RepID=A0A2T7NFS1_POMCA|nr:hypothetical protein C0Q70_20521 [Pomacea canaliculata]
MTGVQADMGGRGSNCTGCLRHWPLPGLVKLFCVVCWGWMGIQAMMLMGSPISLLRREAHACDSGRLTSQHQRTVLKTSIPDVTGHRR